MVKWKLNFGLLVLHFPRTQASPAVPHIPRVLRAPHLAAFPAVLHVHPVVPVIPDALNPKETLIRGAVGVSREWVDEEGLRNLPLPRQNQNPGVHP